MPQFGKHVSDLFDKGELVSFASLVEASERDKGRAQASSQISERERQHNETLRAKYGSKLEFDLKPNSKEAITLDEPKQVGPSTYETQRKKYLQDKFNMGESFSYVARVWNGGHRTIVSDAPRVSESKLKQAFGSYRDNKNFRFEIEIS
jgi:hypothetical protein